MQDKIHHIVTQSVIEGNYDFIHTALASDGYDARRNDQRVKAYAKAWRYAKTVQRQKEREIDEMIQRIHAKRESK